MQLDLLFSILVISETFGGEFASLQHKEILQNWCRRCMLFFSKTCLLVALQKSMNNVENPLKQCLGIGNNFTLLQAETSG